MAIQFVDGSGSDELHFQTVHERALEQELKQSVDRDQQLKDETIRLQQQLNQSQTETASYQSELQQHDQKIEDDLKATAEREERLQADLKKASDTEKNLLRQMTELQLQLQQSAARQKTLEETLKSFQEIYYSKLGKFIMLNSQSLLEYFVMFWSPHTKQDFVK